jgi:hypothetical protein
MINIGFETLVGIGLVVYALWKTDRKNLSIVLIGLAGVALAILGRHSCGW